MRRLRAPSLATAVCVVLAVAPVARATEISPGPPLGGDEAPLDAPVLLARWLETDVSGASDPALRTPLIVGGDAGPALVLPAEPRDAVPPLPLVVLDGAAAPTGGAVVLATADLATSAPAAPASLGRAPGGGTRFDGSAAARNPIELGGDVLDELTARVVRTPEPGTLALFALGAAGLALAAARRRTRAPR